MIGDATGLTIPAIFVTFDAGVDLASTPGATVTVTVEFTADTRTAWNVIAETQAGNHHNVVMAGAHLDSVQDGPGINDNGSGSAALLEMAIQMQKVKPNNAVRFACQRSRAHRFRPRHARRAPVRLPTLPRRRDLRV